MVQRWAQKAEGNLSFSRDNEAPSSPISDLRESCLGTQYNLIQVLSLKLKLAVILLPLTELSFGMEGTQTASGPKLNPSTSSTKVPGKGLSSVSAERWQAGDRRLSNDVSHPRDKERTEEQQGLLNEHGDINDDMFRVQQLMHRKQTSRK